MSYNTKALRALLDQFECVGYCKAGNDGEHHPSCPVPAAREELERLEAPEPRSGRRRAFARGVTKGVAEGYAAAREQAAGRMADGSCCSENFREAEHMQGLCECPGRAAAIRAMTHNDKESP